MEGGVHQDGEVIPVLVEELEFEGVGKLVRRNPGLGNGLEAPND